MKKLIIVFLMFFLTLNLSAKIGLISGKIGYNNDHITNLYSDNFISNDYTGISIKPTVGFYKGNVTLGATLGYTYNKVDTITTNGYSIGAFVEKSYRISDNFYYNTNLSIEVGMYGDSNFVVFNVSPTFTYKLSAKWGVDLEIAKLGYYFSNNTKTIRTDVYDSKLYFNTNTTTLSISYYF